ncbi:hypothetical protein GCM10011391_14730 [Pullulanibacillus camelliae]|uniref:Uncharacterized protein n=1 Tax=Pullulanibacillus camelliae TaxID=1707096 RepID=A0A8J2VQD8_9BACL|nr:hypothetical protein GCM10011391_14730 [Pullulanibacillus camelliae]
MRLSEMTTIKIFKIFKLISKTPKLKDEVVEVYIYFAGYSKSRSLGMLWLF